jgi:hypothetical protein
MACGALRAKSQDKGTFSPKALPWLLRAVGRKDPNVLTMVAKCVETVRPDADRETVLAVIGCLGHDDDTVRCLSAKALGRIGHVAAEGSLAALRRALLDENEGVREAADLAMRQVWKNVETPPAGDLDRLETVP